MLQGRPKPSPGYGILLVAETTAGKYLSAECCVSGKELLRCREQELTASDIGEQAACMLLDEINRCGLNRCAKTGHAQVWFTAGNVVGVRVHPMHPEAIDVYC